MYYSYLYIITIKQISIRIILFYSKCNDSRTSIAKHLFLEPSTFISTVSEYHIVLYLIYVYPIRFEEKLADTKGYK